MLRKTFISFFLLSFTTLVLAEVDCPDAEDAIYEAELAQSAADEAFFGLSDEEQEYYDAQTYLSEVYDEYCSGTGCAYIDQVLDYDAPMETIYSTTWLAAAQDAIDGAFYLAEADDDLLEDPPACASAETNAGYALEFFEKQQAKVALLSEALAIDIEIFHDQAYEIELAGACENCE